jgi:hypothetical protein
MKDQLVALVEAVRLARLEIDCYRSADCRASAEWTVKRLGELLESKDVSEAMAALVPEEGHESPSLVPDDRPALDLRVPYPWRSH